MSKGIVDWQNLGIFPLQDHDIDGVELGMRLQLVGARVSFVPDGNMATDPSRSVMEYAVENGKATIGDIHPWWYWGPRSRDDRDSGSWAQAFAAVITGTSGGFSNGPTGTGTAPSAQFLPIRTAGYTPDGRYEEKSAPIPPGVPPPPIGSVCIAMPGTEEASQQELLICSSGPGGGGGSLLIAPTKRGPPEMGTLVWDLQPHGTLCKDGSTVPGIGGRQARLQSAFRVIPMDQGAAIGAGEGNSIAINYSLSTQDQLAGYGMSWIRLAGGGGTQGQPRLPAGGAPVPPGGGAGGAVGILRDLVHPLPPPGPGVRIDPGGGGRLGEIGGKGQFVPERVGGHGIAYMAHLGAFGPFHGGSEDDIHQIGFTKDGEPCNSGHLSTDAYFYADQGHDGPLFFEEEQYPDPPPQPITTKVHMAWDPLLPHPWLRGSKAGRWRWYAETAAICPEVTGGPDKRITTQTNRPTTGRVPGPGGGGPGRPITPTNNPTGTKTPGGSGGGPTTGGSRQPSHPVNRTGGGRIWTGGPSLRPGTGTRLIPGSRMPSIDTRPTTPGGNNQPSQGVPWEHLTGHLTPLPPIIPNPNFGGSVQGSLGRGSNFGQAPERTLPVGRGEITNMPESGFIP